MWELDSSGPAKWSRHVVVRLPGAALRDTAAAGALVARLLARPEARCQHSMQDCKMVWMPCARWEFAQSCFGGELCGKWV